MRGQFQFLVFKLAGPFSKLAAYLLELCVDRWSTSGRIGALPEDVELLKPCGRGWLKARRAASLGT